MGVTGTYPLDAGKHPLVRSAPMSIVSELLAEIERFCSDAEISESAFSRRAANDGKFVRRLRDGADVNVGTVERTYAYIASERGRLGLTKRRRRPSATTTRKAA